MVIDIETAPIDISELPGDVVTYLVERKSEGRFHPAFSRVIAIGMKCEGGDHPEVVALPDFDGSEADLLAAFWQKVRGLRPTRFVTFNGTEFDVPFLLVRSLVNYIRPVHVDANPWRIMEGNHFDCLLILQGTGKQFSSITLPTACRILGVDVPGEYYELTGRGVADAYRRGQWDEIRRHCAFDVEMTERLYLRIVPFLPDRLPEGDLATQRQITYIRSLAEERGLPRDEVERLVVPGLTRSQASSIIEQLLARS